MWLKWFENESRDRALPERAEIGFVEMGGVIEAEQADFLVADSERELPEEGAYSHADLIGCALWNRKEKVGLVRAVEDYGGGPLLDVTLDRGGEVLVPFTLSICKEIDVAAKTIRAELPEGLLDK